MVHCSFPTKPTKLMKLCELEGLKDFDQLLKQSAGASVCPAICMTEGVAITRRRWSPIKT